MLRAKMMRRVRLSENLKSATVKKSAGTKEAEAENTTTRYKEGSTSDQYSIKLCLNPGDATLNIFLGNQDAKKTI
jgi:hypothetical protein